MHPTSEEDELGSKLANMFVGDQINEHEAMLVQLPGTLPFADLEPHDGKGLHGLLE